MPQVKCVTPLQSTLLVFGLAEHCESHPPHGGTSLPACLSPLGSSLQENIPEYLCSGSCSIGQCGFPSLSSCVPRAASNNHWQQQFPSRRLSCLWDLYPTENTAALGGSVLLARTRIRERQAVFWMCARLTSSLCQANNSFYLESFMTTGPFTSPLTSTSRCSRKAERTDKNIAKYSPSFYSLRIFCIKDVVLKLDRP